MIFPEEPFPFKILTVFDVTRTKAFTKSDDRLFHALSYRVKGNAEFIFEDKILHAGTDDIVFAPAHFKYSLNNGYERMYIIHFETLEKLPEKVVIRHINNNLYIKTLFERILNEWKKGKIVDKYRAYADFYKLIAEITQAEKNSMVTSEERLERVVNYIHENYSDNDISVKKLSEIYCSSEPSFRKDFVEKYGITPNKYIQNLRLKYAKELLESGYFTVSYAAENTGFTDVKYFSRFIKKHTGKSPSDFIKRGQ